MIFRPAFLIVGVVCFRVAFAEEAARVRTSLANSVVKFAVPEKSYVELPRDFAFSLW